MCWQCNHCRKSLIAFISSPYLTILFIDGITGLRQYSSEEQCWIFIQNDIGIYVKISGLGQITDKKCFELNFIFNYIVFYCCPVCLKFKFCETGFFRHFSVLRSIHLHVSTDQLPCADRRHHHSMVLSCFMGMVLVLYRHAVFRFRKPEHLVSHIYGLLYGLW